MHSIVGKLRWNLKNIEMAKFCKNLIGKGLAEFGYFLCSQIFHEMPQMFTNVEYVVIYVGLCIR